MFFLSDLVLLLMDTVNVSSQVRTIAHRVYRTLVHCSIHYLCNVSIASYQQFLEFLTGPVSWCAKKQSTIALSSAEAEHVALSHAAQEAIWLRHLVKDLGHLEMEATPSYEDNHACIKIA